VPQINGLALLTSIFRRRSTAVHNMNILVTGGAGFIGSHTVVALHEAGYRPVIIDNFDNSEPSVLDGLSQILGGSVACYHHDCNDASELRRIITDEKIEGVIHFAAHKAVGESVELPLKYYRNNLNSTIVLLEVMAELGVKHFVFSSSCTVYGQPEVLPVTEASPTLPATSPYGNTKQMCEEIIRHTVRSGVALKAISLRYFNPIGAHESALIGELPRGVPSNLVPFITQTAAGLRPQLTIFGQDYNTPDGTCVRDFIHVLDLAKAHVKALELLLNVQSDNHYDVFNVGTGHGYTVLQVIEAFEQVTGQSLNYVLGPRRDGDIEQIWADVTKSTQQLGWQTERTLAQALNDAWRWQLSLSGRTKQAE
jgi:UDP-glucose 4-epimerase